MKYLKTFDNKDIYDLYLIGWCFEEDLIEVLDYLNQINISYNLYERVSSLKPEFCDFAILFKVEKIRNTEIEIKKTWIHESGEVWLAGVKFQPIRFKNNKIYIGEDMKFIRLKSQFIKELRIRIAANKFGI
jgi:hypothetical protein